MKKRGREERVKGAERVGRRGVLTNDHKGEVETSADGLSVHLVWKRGESDELIFVLQTHTHDTTHCTLRLVLYGEVNKQQTVTTHTPSDRQ